MLCNVRWLGKAFLIRWCLSRDFRKREGASTEMGRRASQAKRLASERLWGSCLLGLFEEYKKVPRAGAEEEAAADTDREMAGRLLKALQAVVRTWGFTRNDIRSLGNLLSKGGHGLSYILRRSISLLHKGTGWQRWKRRDVEGYSWGPSWRRWCAGLRRCDELCLGLSLFKRQRN